MSNRKILYCGCNYGDNNYYDNLFYKYNRIFIGYWKKNENGEWGESEDLLKKLGSLESCDLIAVKKKYDIVAIGEVADKVEDHCTWGDFVTEEDVQNYKFGLEDEIHSVKVKNWIILNDYVQYKKIGAGFINNTHNAYLECMERYKEGIKKMEIINILKQKKQIILQGAPGTGKTYSTAEIAVNLIDGKISDDRKEVMKRYNELIKSNQIFFTTFHQSMDYEEFVEGYKPISNDGNIVYDVKDGIFKEACNKSKEVVEVGKVGLEEAWSNFTYDFSNRVAKGIDNNTGYLILQTLRDNNTFYLSIDDNNIVRYLPENNKTDKWLQLNNRVKEFYYSLKAEKSIGSMSYVKPLLKYLKENYNLSDPIENNENPVVLIIDEINRGNIAKIFGELITLLEADKRKNADNEIEVKLPYSKEVFSVPSNLYIIGTMNTTDRSIGYIDYALRRRFAFITIKADKEKIESFYNDKNSDCKDKALELFDYINNNIINNNLNEEFDSDDIMIGHSYFMAQNAEELKRKLEYEIKPLLLEYYKDGILKSNNDIKDSIKKLAI